MLSKIPGWAWLGATVLAFVAGLVNAVALLGFEHQGVTHVTGTGSLLAVAVADGNGRTARWLAGVLVAFTAGSVLCGMIVQDNPLRLGRRYGAALGVEAVLLLLAELALDRGNPTGVLLTSAACGLQNALASTYSGAIVRTTHLTGMFTDIGTAVGHVLVGRPDDLRLAKLHLLVVAGFLAGGVCGVFAFGRLGYAALFIPCGVTASACAAYEVYRFRRVVRPSMTACPPSTTGSPPAAGPRSRSSGRRGPPTSTGGTG